MHETASDDLFVCGVVVDVEFRVPLRELSKHMIGGFIVAEVTRDARGVAAPGMCEGQRSAGEGVGVVEG